MQRILQEKVVSSREAEFTRMKWERQERISQIIQSRKQEREARRKMIFFLRSEEERQKRLQEEEEARKREGTLLVNSPPTSCAFKSFRVKGAGGGGHLSRCVQPKSSCFCLSRHVFFWVLDTLLHSYHYSMYSHSELINCPF